MEFDEFENKLQEHFTQMTDGATSLFEVDVDPDVLWNLYLDSFPAGTNKIYRTRREYDCSCCRHFIKQFGKMVAIKGNKVVSLWDFETGDDTFSVVAKALAEYVKSRPVSSVFVTKEKHLGTAFTLEALDKGVKTWGHFYLEMPKYLVYKNDASIGEIKNLPNTRKQVFKRSLDEISKESIEVVLELIAQNSLYKGEEWSRVLQTFLELKKEYTKLSDADKDNFAWEKSVAVGDVVGKIRNHSMGTLLVDISEGTELDVAVRKYEVIVAPTNFKRPKAIFTKQMLENAKKEIEKLGYLESLARRFATLRDVSVSNVLFADRGVVNTLEGSVFDKMAADVGINPKKFSKVEEISAQDFFEKVLPTAKSLQVLLENRHASNMVSLIAPSNSDAPSMFKWNNAFGWAYKGNITDSSVRDNVAKAGGSVTGVLRFSIQWNDNKEYDRNDLDAHCVEPSGHEIYYADRVNRNTGGNLDVDIRYPVDGRPAVENITWGNKSKMREGVYRFFVRCYDNRGGKSGFRAEIEFDGQVFSFDYNKELRYKEDVEVAHVKFEDGNFSITEKLPSTSTAKDVWGLKTMQFVPVSVVMYSPNYWDGQGVGNKHYFFMLKNCVNDETPNGFYNEFLKEELNKHKHVLEALGSKLAAVCSKDQLSGVGFSSTQRNDLIVKVIGQTERIIKVKF